MLVQKGEQTPKEVEPDAAGELVRDYLAGAGSHFLEYVRFCDDGSVQLKSPWGVKAVLEPTGNRQDPWKVILC